MHSRMTPILVTFTAVILLAVVAMHAIRPAPVQAQALPVGIDPKLVGTWEFTAEGLNADYTLAADGQFYRTGHALGSWATGTWKAANNVITLVSKDGSKDEQDNIGRPNDLSVVFVNEIVMVAKAQHNQGEENEKDYLVTFHKVK